MQKEKNESVTAHIALRRSVWLQKKKKKKFLLGGPGFKVSGSINLVETTSKMFVNEKCQEV